MSLIVGYNLSHDSSICLVDGGTIRAAAALERSCRLKRGVVAAHAYAAAMTTLTRDVLASEGLGCDDIEYWITTSTESRDQQDEDRLADSLGLLVPAARRLSLPHPGHHLAHAAAAFYTSGYDEAAALVVDAYGSRLDGGRERETGFVFRSGVPPQVVLRTVRNTDRIAGRLQSDGTIGLPEDLSGVGEIYRAVTLALGFYEHGTYDDAGKTMGLAPYGRRFSQENLFIDVTGDGLDFSRAADSLVELGFAVRRSGGLHLRPRADGEPFGDVHRNLAAQVQAEFEQACLYLVEDLVSRTGVRSLVVGGGCFLNSVLNARLLREAPIERLFVFPAATDDGNAVGAALYAHHVLAAAPAVESNTATTPASTSRLRHVYLGPPRLTGRDVTALATSWGLTARRHDTPRGAAMAAAAAIAAGEIIGWFTDRGELGPRALGARSILCHPGIPGMKDALNNRVKFREPFRPFAGSVLAEQAGKWFEMAADSPFMLMVWPVVEAAQDRISEIVHVDGTCRVQTVDAGLPGTYRDLLEEFDRLTGVPVVLNTSFNLRGMPIVERVEDALDCLYGSRLDRVFLGDVEVAGPDHTQLRPVAASSRPSSSAHPSSSAGPVSDGLPQRLLAISDGTATVEQIAAVIGADPDVLVDVALDLRRTGQLRWSGCPQAQPPEYPLPQYEAQPDGR